MATTETPPIASPKLGMTGLSLRTANETISRKIDENIKLHNSVIRLMEARNALQADRDNLWDRLYMPDGEVAQLRVELSQAHELIATLEGQLRDAACQILSLGA